MNDNEIIKSAEQCINGGNCADCLYDNKKGGCRGLTTDLLDLINRQKAEIERHERELDSNFDKWKVLDERTKQRYAELYEEAKGVVRAEAIKEFAERLCEGRVSNDPVVIAVKSELKELTERKEDEGK